MRQKYRQDQKNNAKGLQEAPQTILKRQEFGGGEYGTLGYLPGDNFAYTPQVVKGAPQLALKDNIDMGGGGMIADLDVHDKNIKQYEQRKKANQINESMMSSSTMNFDVTRGTMQGTEVGSDFQTMVPTAKRQKDKEEYERRKQEEEEMKRILEEERQKQLDQYGGVDDNLQAIPIQRILEYKMKQKM